MSDGDIGGLRALGRKTVYSQQYDPQLLESVPNQNRDFEYVVKLNTPEFTTLCPQTGQPDYASLCIRYIPDAHLVERKSLKLYLVSFRNYGDFHENCVVVILKDLRRLLDPQYIEVWGNFLPRDGVSIDPYANFGRPGTAWADMAKARLAGQDLWPEGIDNR
ncbi:preQ(1) synthase [Pasteuria penetrans]|uniref:preQ(1) synthase n=1 Tax=Pasteuria penetrans TaxID=86005 RepID=UPI001FE7466A|nr:preQ(1) synthase [Pasteuria penetrans]